MRYLHRRAYIFGFLTFLSCGAQPNNSFEKRWVTFSEKLNQTETVTDTQGYFEENASIANIFPVFDPSAKDSLSFDKTTFFEKQKSLFPQLRLVYGSDSLINFEKVNKNTFIVKTDIEAIYTDSLRYATFSFSAEVTLRHYKKDSIKIAKIGSTEQSFPSLTRVLDTVNYYLNDNKIPLAVIKKRLRGKYIKNNAVVSINKKGVTLQYDFFEYLFRKRVIGAKYIVFKEATFITYGTPFHALKQTNQKMQPVLKQKYDLWETKKGYILKSKGTPKQFHKYFLENATLNKFRQKQRLLDVIKLEEIK